MKKLAFIALIALSVISFAPAAHAEEVGDTAESTIGFAPVELSDAQQVIYDTLTDLWSAVFTLDAEEAQNPQLFQDNGFTSALATIKLDLIQIGIKAGLEA